MDKNHKKIIFVLKQKSPMRKFIQFITIVALITGPFACNADSNKGAEPEKEQSNMVKKLREDGTLSSMNPVDENGYVHGVKVNFYEDGLTVHSKVTYEHGRKDGPAIWFFKNGKIYEHTSYIYNRKNGLTKRYYETGELKEEVIFDSGEELPGKKMYNKKGELTSD